MEVQLPVDNTSTMTNNGQRIGDSFYPNYSSQHPYQQHRHSNSDVSHNPASISVPTLNTYSFDGDFPTSQQYSQYSQHPEYSQQSQYSHRPTNGPTPRISVHPVQPYEGRPPSLTSRLSGRRPQPPPSQYPPNMPQHPSVSQRSKLIIGTSASSLVPNYSDEYIPPFRKSMENLRNKNYHSTYHSERIRSLSYSEPSPPSAGSDSSSTPSSPSSYFGKQHAPIVYPALLSKVADAFRSRMILSNRMKDNLEYKDCFDGREAVVWLYAQKFFHDVTYDHRLRDSSNELYQFKKMLSILSSDNYDHVEYGKEDNTEDDSEESDLPNGVFTLLTDCYSPTCTRDNLCYSIICPRRLEQSARKNMKPTTLGLKRSASRGSLSDKKDRKLWIHTVPPEIANSVSEAEKKRQEAINEVIYTEKDFVHDLEYLRDVSQNIIPESRREEFIHDVFYNIIDIYNVNSKLNDALQKRQTAYTIVEQIGDIFLEYIPLFDPFIKYGAHQLLGKYEFEKEKANNPTFAKFVEETERLPESRKLELNGYLTKPTTRLGRYPLLLDAVLKNTPSNHPDKINIPKVINIIKEFLTNVNIESGKSENRFNLQQLNDQLSSRGNEDLKLTEEGRQLVFKGSLKKPSRTGEPSDLQVFLFDHALLMVKTKTVNKAEHYKIYRKPIPLELLSISTSEGQSETSRSNTKRPQSILHGMPGKAQAATRGSNSNQFALTLCCLGKKGFAVTLYATTVIGRKKWIEHIEKQKELNEKGKVFEKTVLIEKKHFHETHKILCAVFFDDYRKLAFGTDNGVYVLDISQNQTRAIQALQIEKVHQIEILEDYRLVLVLTGKDKSLYSYPIDALDPSDTNGTSKRSRKISAHTSFFKSGTCRGKTLITVVKNSTLQSTIKTLEPLEQNVKNKIKGPTFKLLRGSSDVLKTYKEFCIPAELTSVHYLKKNLCVGCTKGFEVVDLETLKTQGLLHPEDTSHDFVLKKENVKPIAIYRVGGGDFLLCYDEFAFFINKEGWRSRPDKLITWEGTPTSFAFHYPYVLAFEPSFIEIRHIETGLLEQIIIGHNVRYLYSDPRGNILVATNDTATNNSEVFSLNIPNGRRNSLISEATSIATLIFASEDGNNKFDSES
ncbi:12332_t:CDS:10 [Cetraspora pellucida]|uniref:12332_t:CDS:1 n=1 Tax=Cetraspora pellucida TaxID=1433469 RepID=A0ACA9JY87_9GLOM|nr:12332_t:CDS:10 [Cetraspora pellucida]